MRAGQSLVARVYYRAERGLSTHHVPVPHCFDFSQADLWSGGKLAPGCQGMLGIAFMRLSWAPWQLR